MTYSRLIKNDKGLYQLEGPVEPREIIETAAEILLEELVEGQPMTQATDAAEFLKLALAHEKAEHFAALFLNNKHQVLHFERLFAGTI
ncbi:MAG: DNA repair protein RadC, partial [Alcanivorax sp.]|nr:DNA repair protein RadC [Alcanivorax sp.]